jgi:LmbE family N-acetylglucosaminyl deacetylase
VGQASTPARDLHVPPMPDLEDCPAPTRPLPTFNRLTLDLMFLLRRTFLFLFPLSLFVPLARAQENTAGAAEVRLALGRLNTLGSVLMIGAHPDDEHSDSLAYFARGRSMRTGYLSVTRGEGGQNLIGPEQGDLLGIIRTQELLAARRIDGAEQFFTRAIDFGFSKSPDETLAKWGREKILSDIVWVIRRFRPDVIILCFSGTSRDGHGHHQASAILAREAFAAAADKTRFPEQLRWAGPWQAKRVVWNVYGESDRPGQVRIDTGEYNPLIGCSYAELAAMSRSMHRSQGMGNRPRRGSVPSSFAPIAGEPASKDLFDGIDTTWNRVPGGAAVASRLREILGAFDPATPEQLVPALLEIRGMIASIAAASAATNKEPWAARKLVELDETVALCAGLWLDASAGRWDAVPGATLPIRVTAIERSHVPMRLVSVSLGNAAETGVATELPYNQPHTLDLKWAVPDNAAWSQPYWLVDPPQGDAYTARDQSLIGLAENPPLLEARFRLATGPYTIDITRPISHRYVDRTRGELRRPLAIVPPVAAAFSDPVYVFPDRSPREVELTLKSSVAGAAGELRVSAPDGWRVEPASHTFKAADDGEQVAESFRILPPSAAERGQVRATATIGGKQIAPGMRVISYPHFPPQVVFPAPISELVRADIRILAKRIGYVMGAGDQVPDALRQLGCDVTLLSAVDLGTADLGRFDAIVAGVRAYNVRPELRSNQHRLLEYVSNGGTLVVQYNVLDYGTSAEALAKIGPYPIQVGRSRVSVEEAPVTFTDPASPLLRSPNLITEADFRGWIQERGLYFADQWDPRYKTLFESHDPGEPPQAGGTVYTRYGKGVYVFTAYSWFRELPAGVPGAYRIFANLLSAGETLK